MRLLLLLLHELEDLAVVDNGERVAATPRFGGLHVCGNTIRAELTGDADGFRNGANLRKIASIELYSIEYLSCRTHRCAETGGELANEAKYGSAR